MRWNIHFRGKCENIWQYQKLVIKFSLKHVRQRWKCSYPIFFRSPNCNCKRERNSNKVKNICFMLILHWAIDHWLILSLVMFQKIQIWGEEHKNHFHFIIKTSNTNTNFQGFLLPWRCKAVRAASWPEKARYDDIIIALLHQVTIISMVHSKNNIIVKNRTASIFSLSFSPCGAFLACSSNTETVHVFRFWMMVVVVMVVVVVLVFTMMLMFLPCSCNIDTIHVIRSVNYAETIWTFLS